MLNLGIVAFGDSALNDTINSITKDLYQFVSTVQKPKLNDQLWLNSAKTGCKELAERVALAHKSISDRQKALTISLENMSNTLQAYFKELEGSPNAVRLRHSFRSLSFAYEDLVVQARRAKSKPVGQTVRHVHLKPENYNRNIFHVFMGALGFVMYQFFLTYEQVLLIMIPLLTFGIFLEVTRRVFPKWNNFLMDHVFRAISRPRERNHINSATFYLAAITLIAVLFPKPAALIGLLVLALADPAATLSGKKWGVQKLWREKSYLGTSVFFVTALVTTLSYLVVFKIPMSTPTSLALALCVALAGTLAELFSEFFDDNFTIPIICAGVASLWF